MSALGATVAVVAGHAVQNIAGYAYALIFTAVGALLLTGSRGFARSVRQEAFIGVLYVVATASTVLVVDHYPAGAEHVSAGGRHPICDRGRVGEVHRPLRRHRSRALAHTTTIAGRGGQSQFGHPTNRVGPAFYFVVRCRRSLVGRDRRRIAGVLFSCIVPALVGSLFSSHIGMALVIGWLAGITRQRGRDIRVLPARCSDWRGHGGRVCRRSGDCGAFAPSSDCTRKNAAAIVNSSSAWRAPLLLCARPLRSGSSSPLRAIIPFWPQSKWQRGSGPSAS